MCSTIAEALSKIGDSTIVQQAERHITAKLANLEPVLVNGHVVNDSTYDKYVVVESDDQQ